MSEVVVRDARTGDSVMPLSPILQHFDALAGAPDGVPRLRQLILTLAVQGKLVTQDLCDVPASRVLQAVSDERSRLISAGQIRKANLPERLDKSEHPFKVPVGWAWVRLDQLSPFGLSDGDWIETKDQDPNGEVRLVQLADVGDGYFKDKSARFISAAKCRELNCTLLQPADILVARLPAPIGRACVFPGVGQPAITAVDIAICRVGKGLLPSFFSLAINAPFMRSRIESYGKGATRFRVSTGHLKTLPIPVPPTEEQARIVARVDELMRLCDSLEAKGRLEAEQHARLLGMLLSTLTESTSPEELAANWQRVAEHFDLMIDRPEAVDALEQSVLKLAVRGLLTREDPCDAPVGAFPHAISTSGHRGAQTRRTARLPPEAAESAPPCSLPSGWHWTKFANVAEIASDLVSPLDHLSAWQVAPDCIEKNTGRLLTRRTVRDAGVISPNHRFVAGQILYSKIRPSLSKVVRVDFDGVCSADMYPVSSRINPDYLLLYMLSDLFLDQVAVAENRVKMPKLNQSALNGFLVSVPPLAEQARIVARVSELRRFCDNLRESLAAYQVVQSRLAAAHLVEHAAA